MTTAVITHYIAYYEGGRTYPAYCLNMSLPGAEEESYGVEVGSMEEIANNQAVWRVLLNGFPYKTASDMGLDNDYQAFQATKQAIYCVLGQKDPSRFSGKTEIGRALAEKVKELANIGLNGTQTYKDPVITTNAITDVGVDTINNKYISQTFRVDSQVDIRNLNVILDTATGGIPEGTIVTDVNNNIKTTFNKGDTFKILALRNNIRDNITINYSVSGQAEAYPILIGKAPNSFLQDYVLTTDPFVMSTTKGSMKYKPTGDFELEKIANADSKITHITAGTGLKGATFIVKSKDGTFEKEVTTDEFGKFKLSGLSLGEYIVKEKLAPEYYIKGKEIEFDFRLEYDGDSKDLVVENTPVDIKVSVNKIADKKNVQGKEIVTYEIDKIKNLSNVRLDNFTLTDDLPKEVRIQNLETGIYNENLKYSIEYNTNKRQNVKLQDNLSTTVNNKIDFTKIKLEDDEYVTSYSLKFGNVKIGFGNTSKMKVVTKVNEGLADKSKFINNVKVSGTYLEAKTEDRDDVPVEVYENTLKVYKVSKEYNQYLKLEANTPIDGTVFEILDENQKYIATVKSANGGKIEYKYLETNKQYYLKEISTASYYVVNNELIPFKFDKNGDTVELIVKNDNVNLKLDVEKEAPTEAKRGEIIDYTFNHIGNFSNTSVGGFVWADALPRQVRIQELQTGIWNEELDYEIQYITNKNTNWKNIGENYTTLENHTIDLSSTILGLEEGEYVKAFRLVFGEVKAGFEATTTPIVKAKVNEDVEDKKIFVNNTYVTGIYGETQLVEKDDAHTVVYTKTPTEDKELPKTGLDY